MARWQRSFKDAEERSDYHLQNVDEERRGSPLPWEDRAQMEYRSGTAGRIHQEWKYQRSTERDEYCG